MQVKDLLHDDLLHEIFFKTVTNCKIGPICHVVTGVKRTTPPIKRNKFLFFIFLHSQHRRKSVEV